MRKAARAKIIALVGSGQDPLDYVCALVADETLDPMLRLQAATTALPYMHPKLSAAVVATAKVGEGRTAAQALDALLAKLRPPTATVTAGPADAPILTIEGTAELAGTPA